MFLHNLKYELITTFRAKSFILWLILFPIVLGTLFKVSFGSIYEKVSHFSSIPTAIVMEKENDTFRTVIDSVSDGDSSLLSPTYTDKDTALEMLKNGEVEGVLTVGEKTSLTVTGEGMAQTILRSFVKQYTVYETIIEDTIKSDPASVPAVIKALSDDSDVCKEIPVTEGNTDMFIQYFYNLIAMVAMFGSITGLHVAETNQANMSMLGARKNISPVPKSISLLANLVGSFIAQTTCTMISVSFIAFVLRVDFGNRLLLVYAAAATGGCLGVSLGFFIGSIGRLSSEIKNSIAMAVTMSMCFLSGLMIGNIKGILAECAPWVNWINPAAMISDSFYCLNLYSDFERFNLKLLAMIGYIVLFVFLGIILSRRKKYASI